MNTTAQKAPVQSFTADEMEKRRMQQDTFLAEIMGTVAVLALVAGLFIGLFVRTLWV